MLAASDLFEQYQGYAKALAHTLARRIASRRVSVDDMVQWGMGGLWEAAQRFNQDGAVTFETFAYYRVRGAIFDELRKLSMVSRSVRKKAAELRGQDEYMQSEVPQHDPKVSDAEHAKQVRETVRSLGAIFLASQLASEEGEDPMAAIAEEEQGDASADREMIEKTKVAMKALPERQQHVLQEFYVKGRSMSDIATELGVNKATISREHTRAVNQLREAMGLEEPPAK